MTIKKRILIITLISLIIISALFAFFWFYASYKLSHMGNYKESITKTVSEKLNRDVTYETGKATLTFSDGLSVRFTNVVIKEKDGSSDFLNVKDAFLRVSVISLLRNRLVFREVILNQPRISLKRDRAGILNIADLLTKKEDNKAPKIRKLITEKGLVTFLDEAASEEGLLTSLENLDCRIDSPFWTKISRFKIKTSVLEGRNKAELAMDGFYRSASSEKPFYENKMRASIHLKGTDIKHYSSYLKKYTPIEQMGGYMNADITFSGKFSDFTSKGIIAVKDALIAYPGVFRGNVQPRQVYFDYDLARDSEHLELDVASLKVDNFEASGNFAINEMDKKDPLLEATAVTSTFSLKEVKPYIPWNIIHKNVGSFIEAHVKDGNFRLVEGKLKGRQSQIADMNKMENAGILYLRAEVNKGVFELDPTAPVINDISGILELKNRQFSLKKIKGLFGSSPCTLEGYISDYALPSPVVYTADANIQPVRDEVLWLLGKEKFHALSFKGPSTILLTGKGTSDNYHINASWDLTDTTYAYPDVMEKPRTRKNQLKAKIIINKDAINVSSFNYDLPPVNVSGAAMHRFSGKKPLSLIVQSKMFDIREAVPILPALRTFEPSGTCSINVNGSGDLSDPGSIQWKGNVSLTNVSLKPSANVKPLKGLTGNAFFKGSSMETSLLKAQMGQSNIQGNFRIDDFRNPKVACQFNTYLLRTADMGLQSPEGEVNFNNVKGQITIEDNLIHLDNLSFKLGKSSFNLSGDVKDFASPKITTTLTSPYISWDDFIRLLSLEYKKKGDNASSGMTLNATLRVDAGTFNDIEFKKLNAGLQYTLGIVNIETLEAGLFDGSLKAKGKMDIRPQGQHHYEANLTIKRMSLEKLQRYLEIGGRTLTGKLSITGDLSATGRNADELKKTATGKFQVKADKGVLKEFSALSKIFSILNVLQLAKLKLPDVITDGMPYNKITFDTSLKDGVFSIKDLFIDSDSLQISGSGKVDFLKENTDFSVAIHPLQSLDLIAAKIPIAGGFITDKKGKLISVHFKISGTWSDPNVRPASAPSK